MKTIQTLVAILAIASLAAVTACGSKNKKTTDQPAPVQSASADTDEPATPAATDTTDETGPTDPSANLNDKILFEFDSTDLSDGARSALEENATWLKEDAARTLLIEGHTDEQGTNEYNLGLGDRRARASKDYLVALGIAEKRIRIITYGEERPESSEDSQNRRSMFIATKKKK